MGGGTQQKAKTTTTTTTRTPLPALSNQHAHTPPPPVLNKRLAACWPTCSGCRNGANDRRGNELAAAFSPPTEENTAQNATRLQEESGGAVRGSGVFTGPGGRGRGPGGGLARPTCSNSRSYPEEMKTSISAELHRSDAPNPPHFLAGSAAILCFHSWGPEAPGPGPLHRHLSAHRDPRTGPGFKARRSFRWKIESLKCQCFPLRIC